MKWPFDPEALAVLEVCFVIFMGWFAVIKLWIAWILLVTGVMGDLFG